MIKNMITKFLKLLKRIVKAEKTVVDAETSSAITSLAVENNEAKKTLRTPKLNNKRVKHSKPTIDKRSSKITRISKESTAAKRMRNPKLTLEKVKKVDLLRQQNNMSIEKACNQVGIAPGYYYKLKNKA